MRDAFKIFKRKIRESLLDLHSIKVNACFSAKFKRLSVQGDENNSENVDNDEIMTFYIQTKSKPILVQTNLKVWFKDNIRNVIDQKIDEMHENGSGWTLHEINDLTLNINKHVMFRGSSYIPLPKGIDNNNRCIVNVHNDDEKCFVWSVLAALHPKKRGASAVNQYRKFEKQLNLNGISFPVALDDIDTFERDNPTISINIYVIVKEYDPEEKKSTKIVVPVRLTKSIKSNHIHLLMLHEIDLNDNDDNDDDDYDDDDGGDDFVRFRENDSSLKYLIDNYNGKFHYCWIKNLAGLIQAQCTKVNRVKKYLCDRCLHYFYSESKRNEHTEECMKLNKCKITLPSEEHKWMKFRNFQFKLENPFIIYADFESLLIDVEKNNESKQPKGSYQMHKPFSVGYYFQSRCSQLISYYKSYTSEVDCVNWFIDELHEIAKDVWHVFHEFEPMNLTKEEKRAFRQATVCHICDKNFELDDLKVRDHNHYTGAFRGAAHNSCNLKYQQLKMLTVVFHNLEYDSHFIIEALASKFNGSLHIIPKNAERYMSFTQAIQKSELVTGSNDDEDMNYHENLKLRFIDSFRFLPAALSKIVETIPKENLTITKKEWQHLSEDDFSLITRKGVQPYDYLDDMNKLYEDRLPPIEAFYNRLNDSHISEAEYEHAKKIWNAFEINSLLSYSELYLRTDVLLLADAFENFRNKCMNLYGLEVSYYYSMPGLTFDAMLKYTKVEIELITDIDQLLFVERCKYDKNIFFSVLILFIHFLHLIFCILLLI